MKAELAKSLEGRETFDETIARIRKANARISTKVQREPGSMEGDFRQVLAELEVLSHGSTQSFAAAPGGGSDKNYGCPPGDAHPPHLRWRAEWEKATREESEGRRTQAEANERRETILRHARDELVTYRKRDMAKIVAVMETEEQLEARVVEEGNGWSVDEIARHCRCTPKLVRKARLKAGRSIVTGNEPPTMRAKLPRSERAEEARKMRAEGMTMRQIAMLLKCDPMTVHRDLAA